MKKKHPIFFLEIYTLITTFDNQYSKQTTGYKFISLVSTIKSSTRKEQININQKISNCEVLFYTVFHAKQ